MLTHRQPEQANAAPPLKSPDKKPADPEPLSSKEENDQTMEIQLESVLPASSLLKQPRDSSSPSPLPATEKPEETPLPAATPLPNRASPQTPPQASSSSRQLRETMRKINARNSPVPDEVAQREADARERAKSASTLPEAMARVHQENRFQAKLNRALNEAPASVEELEEETSYAVDDPAPGWGKGIFHFLFSFGRFANGVQLAQPVWATVLFWLICGLGSLLPLMPLLLPTDPGLQRLMNPEDLARFIGLGVCIGLASVLGISLLFNLTVWARFGRVGLMFGLRTVTAALLPLALVQFLAFGISLALLGEAFLRGATLPWFLALQTWVLPLLWCWGGLRLGQAVSRMARPPFYASSMLLLFLPIVFAATYIPIHPSVTQWRIHHLAEAKEEILNVRDLNPMQRLAASEKFAAHLPFWAMEEKCEIYFIRLDLYLSLNDVKSAREEMLLLDWASIPESSVDRVAYSVNLYLARERVTGEKLDRLMARVENYLTMAIQGEDVVVNAYDWLSIYKEEFSMEEATQSAGTAYQLVPTPARFRRYIDLLHQQHAHEIMWDTMLGETSPPQLWSINTLEQLAQAADELNKPKRAIQLRKWADTTL